jgi:hypothetical protein
MSSEKKADQKAMPTKRTDGRQLTGKDVELNVEELEERIAPVKVL